jgi:hypothetical protein
MAIFPRPVRPSRAIADLAQFLRQRRRHEMVFAALAVALTAAMVWAVVKQFEPKVEWKQPTVLYVEQWSAKRSAAEVQARLARDAPKEAAARKKLEAEAAIRRAQFKRVGEWMGIE